MKKSPKILKIGGIILGVLLLLIIAAYALTLLFLEPYLSEKLRNYVHKFANIEYDINFEEMDLQPFQGSIHLHKLELIPVKSLDSLNSDNYKVVIEDIYLRGMDVYDYLFNDELEINSIQLENSELVIYRYKRIKDQDSIHTPSANDTKKSIIKSISLSSFKVIDGTFKIVDVTPTGRGTFFQSEISFDVEDIHYVFGDDIVKDFNYGDFNAALANISSTKSADSLRIFKLKNVNIHGNQHSLNAVLEQVTVTTTLGKYQLAETLGYESDWINLKIPKIKISNLQLKPLLLRQSFLASTIEISNPIMSVFRDKRYPFPETKESELPINFIQGWKYKFAIDSLFIKDGNIAYQEHAEGIDEPGEINFTSLYTSLYNLTNDSASLAKNGKHALMSAQTKIMGAVTLTAEFNFPLTTNEPSSVKGNIGGADLTVFNPMLSKVGYSKVKSGKCHSMDFNFSFDEEGASGEMIFLYDNLEIETISRNDGDDDSFGQNIKTFLADFIVDDENLKGDLRKGVIEFPRNKKKSMINFWWKSVLTGIKSSVGMKGEVPHNNE